MRFRKLQLQTRLELGCPTVCRRLNASYTSYLLAHGFGIDRILQTCLSGHRNSDYSENRLLRSREFDL
jgi:hypothetical protein